MKNKLENLLSFDDFNTGWKTSQTKTKRTETGLDILKENLEDGIEEIIPEGLPEDLPGLPENEEDAIEQIKEFLDSEPDEDVIEEMVNQLRDTLLEMEQMGSVDEETTDELDEKHEGDWIEWIKDVIELPDFPEEGLNNIMEIINNLGSDNEFNDNEFNDNEFDEENEFDDNEFDGDRDDEDIENEILTKGDNWN